MELVAVLLGGLFFVAALVNLVCFVLIVYLMFKNEEVVLGIVCIAMLACGLGAPVAFLFGWLDVNKYQAREVMLIWTSALVSLLALTGLMGALSSLP